jgi:hypothetical protein
MYIVGKFFDYKDDIDVCTPQQMAMAHIYKWVHLEMDPLKSLAYMWIMSIRT